MPDLRERVGNDMQDANSSLHKRNMVVLDEAVIMQSVYPRNEEALETFHLGIQA